MITSRLAFSYNRSVYALPGRGDDSRSQGCNHLIREGVAEIIDSLDGLNVQLGLCEKGRGCGGMQGCCRIVRGDLTERYSRTLPEDGLCDATGLPYRSVAEVVALLENDGMISVDLLRRCSIRG